MCASELGGCGKIGIIADTFEEFVAREVNRHYDAMPPPEPQADGESLERQLAADEKALDELAQDRYVRRVIGAREFRAARRISRRTDCNNTILSIKHRISAVGHDRRDIAPRRSCAVGTATGEGSRSGGV